MKLASFIHAGRRSYGVVDGDTVLDAGAVLDHRYADLRAVLGADNGLADLAAMECAPRLNAGDVQWLPAIPNPDKVLCVGLNYLKHIVETGRETPKHPTLFTRFASAQVGHEQPLILPDASTAFDFEGELAVVIGKPGRHIAKDNALDHVAGYSLFNDGSIRDWQRHTLQFTAGKNFVGSGSFGPWIVTRDEIPNVDGLVLETRLNGEIVQREGINDLLFKIPALIEYISTFTELLPGDVIATGTPGGVGAFRNPPLWMKPGDVVEVQVEGIGTLRNTVKPE
ncbi:5-oxopent-3-ene-1,2,5-tricarboxylate decarboxylase [Pseudomonas fragi]|uniref:fumarylacetoacetate hydrolase family protein n=1 Tax=Pseudomonas TaxID=286 RepID=UPI000BA24276|nr:MULTISPECIES: fumarylacetoacetate hydrolase family protein [Pseudomonas]AOA05049.1 5-oxopent-3-ene-1,2,5-tricarboxylate decarboxylase [Pseudomonas sp. TMW 2.1634]NNB16347.1 fumarylacetoacetate hydrolase family protein [Pseudomonas fragi]NNB22320.1 fumarylacetoacetate hydrolase family protein [Pseudomonas fragi]PAA27326.1 5-oxopent-3-ene-1,2,5-tricarboxylate decarboxylase [Pseudomonas fragi]